LKELISIQFFKHSVNYQI